VSEPKVSAPVAAPVPDDESLKRAVADYEAAITSGNRDAVRRVFPAVTESELREIDSLKDNFGRERYRMNVFITSSRIEGTRATLRCRIIHNGIDDRGKTLSRPQDATLKFEWTGRTWVRVR
jgi:hypothetical protein